jgi:putative transposase
MKKKRFSVEQIVAVVKQAELGVPVAEVIRKVGISEQTFYRWKKQYVGLETDQARQMKQLQEENSRLKQLVADRPHRSLGERTPSEFASEYAASRVLTAT